MIIGITGTIGAGKGTVVEYLKQRGFTHYSSSGVLREILAERGLPATRLNMSMLADELMQQYAGGVLQVSHERAQAAGDTDYILEAIHRTSEATYIRSIGGVMLGVDADIRTRFERSILRADGEKDNVTFEEFLENSKREDEGKGETGANIRAVLKDADAVITNNGSLEELTKQVDEALARLLRK